MRVLRDWTAGNFAALSALVVAAGVCGTDLVRSLSVDPPPAVTAPGVRPMPRLAERRGADDSSARSVATAIRLDPFLSDRVGVEGGYAGGEADTEAAGPEIPITTVAPATPALRLQGVAVMPSGAAVAVVSVEGRPAQLMRVGQPVTDGLRITRIERGSATLAGPDTTIVLRLPGSAPGPAQGGPQAPPRVATGDARGTRP